MPQVLNRQKALAMGYTDEEIEEYLKKNKGITVSDFTPPTPTPEEQSPVEKFLRSDWLSTGTSMAGGALGALMGAGIGSVPAGIAGGMAGEAAGETLERGLLRLMGEDPDENEETGFGEDLKGIAGETALAGLFGGVGAGVGKVAGKTLKAVPKLLKLEPENFAQRSVANLSPEKTAKMNLKLGVNQDPSKTVHRLLLSDVDEAGVNVLELPVPQRLAFADKRIASLADQRRTIYSQFSNATQDAAFVKSKVLDGMDDLLYMKGTRTLTPEGKALMKMVDKEFESGVKAYGKTWNPMAMENFENTLSSRLSSWKETGKGGVDEVRRRIANTVSGLNKDVPGVRDLNRKMAAYYDLKDTFAKGMRPELSYGGSFGSSLQSAPAMVATTTISPAVGATMYLASFFGTQATKDPEVAGKIARTLFKIKEGAAQAGDGFPPFLKRFYAAMRPVVTQGARGATTGNSDENASDLLLSETLPMPEDIGMGDLPEGRFIERGALGEDDGEVKPRKLGLTKQDAAIAMLMYPKQRTLIKDVYEMLKEDEGTELDAEGKKSLVKLEAAYGALNEAKALMGAMGGSQGRLKGSATQLSNMLFQNQPAYEAYRVLKASSIPVFARVIGGDVGNLNEYEQQRVKDLLPDITDSPEQAAAKFALVERMLDERIDSLYKNGTSEYSSESTTEESSEEEEESSILDSIGLSI